MEFSFSLGKKKPKKEYVPVILGGSEFFKEKADGEMVQEDIKIPRSLGVQPPINDHLTTQIYEEVGFVGTYIDKYVNRIMGPGWVIEGDEKVVEILRQWEKDTGFRLIAREWLREALYKRGGYLNIGYDDKNIPDELKLLDARTVYVDRTKKGELKGYNQYFGELKGLKSKDYTDKVIPFKPNDIAAIHVKKTGSRAYGLGVLWQNVDAINDYIGAVKSLHKIVERKANSPLHIKIGSDDLEGPQPSQETISQVKGDVQTLTNETEFVTDGGWDIKAIDFGDFGKKFEEIIETDRKQLDRGFQVPQVIMGDGNIPEGLAKWQSEDWEITAKSIQEQMTHVIIDQLYKPILEAQGFGAQDLTIRWDVNTEAEKARRVQTLVSVLQLPQIQPALRNLAERDLGTLLGYAEEEFLDPDERREEFENQEQPPVPGQNAPSNQTKNAISPPPTPRTVNSSDDRDVGRLETESDSDPFSPNATIKEWLGFDYLDYIRKIREAVEEDNFSLLAAADELEEEAGKLSQKQIDALREVLDDGFAEARTMKEIARNIEEQVKPSDLKEIEDGEIKDKTLSKAENRPISIARSETTRLANEGAARQYAEAGVEEFVWIASADACDECQALNDRKFPIDSSTKPPAHPMCRCTIVAVTE